MIDEWWVVFERFGVVVDLIVVVVVAEFFFFFRIFEISTCVRGNMPKESFVIAINRRTDTAWPQEIASRFREFW